MLFYGMTVTDCESLSYGEAVNIASECSRLQAIKAGKEVADPEREYRILKSYEKIIEEMHRHGEITESKYRSYREAIERWEEDGEDD